MKISIFFIFFISWINWGLNTIFSTITGKGKFLLKAFICNSKGALILHCRQEAPNTYTINK